MTGWVGDEPGECGAHLLADADFAGDSKLSRSTSGWHLAPERAHTPAGRWEGNQRSNGACRARRPRPKSLRQTKLSADLAFRRLTCGPCFSATPWSLNVTTITRPQLRHISRTHGISLRWLAERFESESVNVFYERSAMQASDIYTKGLIVPSEWD